MIDYYPYGKILREYHEGETERYLTTQHERDEETGLDYRGARFYDADIARFNSLDPLAADFAAVNAYSYVMGNPISLIDPDGKAPWKPGEKAKLILKEQGHDSYIDPDDNVEKTAIDAGQSIVLVTKSEFEAMEIERDALKVKLKENRLEMVNSAITDLENQKSVLSKEKDSLDKALEVAKNTVLHPREGHKKGNDGQPMAKASSSFWSGSDQNRRDELRIEIENIENLIDGLNKKLDSINSNN